jgi:hypothetical protein
MPGRVDHVVNFDFPRNPIDYIHRAGRFGFLVLLRNTLLFLLSTKKCNDRQACVNSCLIMYRRTARAGVTGKITSLLQKRDKVLASRIEDAILHGRPLDELSGDRSNLPPNMRYVPGRPGLQLC